MRAPRSLTRRRFLLELGAGAAVAACGGAGPDGGPSDGGGRSLRFANWGGYIDEPGTFPTTSLEDFTAETSIRVDYQEVIDDNDSFLATIEPALVAGRPTGWDLAVLTDFAAARLRRAGWLEQLDVADRPGAGSLIPSLTSPPFDPDRSYSLPWQAGLTGVLYDVGKTGRELTSIDDVFDPAFAGRVIMLNEPRDTLGLIMLGLAIDPAQATAADIAAAIERLRPAVASGHIRGFTGGDFVQQIASGEAWIAFAWSGDADYLGRDDPALRFLLPPEGAMLWADDMIVPKGAVHQAEAEELMRFVYRAAVAAKIASYVAYVCPVVGAQAALRELADASGDAELAAVAEDPLVFPTAETLENAHIFADLDDADEQAMQAAFAELIGA